MSLGRQIKIGSGIPLPRWVLRVERASVGIYEWPMQTAVQRPQSKRQVMGRPHNHLWATIARAFVTTVEGFGATEMPDGIGGTQSLTGWIPELLR